MTAPLSDAELAECRAAATSVELTLLNEIDRLKAALAERDNAIEGLIAQRDCLGKSLESADRQVKERDRLGGEVAAMLVRRSARHDPDCLCDNCLLLARARAAGWLK